MYSGLIFFGVMVTELRITASILLIFHQVVLDTFNKDSWE